MFSPEQYELLDFGGGRKLERFGAVVVDRPAPAADGVKQQDATLWKSANARFRRVSVDEGQWTTASELPANWLVRHDGAAFELKLTPFGHVGLFPEQAENWDWIAAQARHARRPLKVLNLFAYTGGSTLAAAGSAGSAGSAGAKVVHVDAAKNVVAWARRNVELSGLSDAPIRWLTEDARKFVDRELRRGNRYDAVILDPPSYGHGPKGEPWKLETDLLPLLAACGELTAAQRAFLLLTCHSPNVGPAEAQAMFADAIFGHCQAGVATGTLTLQTASGRKLTSGVFARWP